MTQLFVVTLLAVSWVQLTTQPPLQPLLVRETQADKAALQPKIAAALKEIDEYKAEAEKTTKTNAEAKAEQKANSAIYQLPAGLFLCGPPSPDAARKHPDLANAEGCTEIRSLFMHLASDIKMLSILTQQHGIAPDNEEIKRALAEAIAQFKEDRAWVLAQIEQWKLPASRPAAEAPKSSTG